MRDYSDHLLIPIAEVCRMLGWSTQWFYENQARLAAEEGFPAPAKRVGQKQYSKALVRQWADRQVAEYPSPADGSAEDAAQADADRARDWRARNRPKKSKES